MSRNPNRSSLVLKGSGQRGAAVFSTTRYRSWFWLGIALLLLGGCATLSRDRLAANLASAMLNQDDIETVRSGAPAYLLLLDSLVEGQPNDSDLLLAAAKLYSAYGSTLAREPQRRQRLTARSLDYARRAICIDLRPLCARLDAPYPQFAPLVEQLPRDSTELIYSLASSWANWIRVRRGDWQALAQLPKVDRLFQWLIEQDPGLDHGRAQLYLALMNAQLPAAMGGHPEQARERFEQALRYSGGRDLIVQLEYARSYARLVYDQALHDRLLKQVLAADPRVPERTLSNIFAQQQARILLHDDYF